MFKKLVKGQIRIGLLLTSIASIGVGLFILVTPYLGATDSYTGEPVQATRDLWLYGGTLIFVGFITMYALNGIKK